MRAYTLLRNVASSQATYPLKNQALALIVCLFFDHFSKGLMDHYLGTLCNNLSTKIVDKYLN